MLKQIQYEVGCERCGTKTGSFQFHHRDPSTKEFGILGNITKPLKPLIAEIEKCDILCVDCHKYIHRARGRIVESDHGFDVRYHITSRTQAEEILALIQGVT